MKWTKEAIEAPHTQREIEQASEDLRKAELNRKYDEQNAKFVRIEENEAEWEAHYNGE